MENYYAVQKTDKKPAMKDGCNVQERVVHVNVKVVQHHFAYINA